MSEKKQVTFEDIAKYTGFSKTTISRYFNRPATVTENNRKIIREALDTLGYQENKVAHILATGKTEYVGVIVPSLELDYYSSMLDKILKTYNEFGYKFIVFVGSNDAAAEMRYLEELLAYQIEGLIIMNHTLPSMSLCSLSVPVVAIEREDRFINSVNSDNYLGGIEAASLLLEKPCDVLIHLNSPTDESIPAYRRILGFKDYCLGHGLPCDIMIRDFGYSHEELHIPVKSVFEEMENRYPGMKKGVFCANDVIANYLLGQVIRKYGGLTPYYRIVGFDNTPMAVKAAYSISTIDQQIDVIAREAFSLLMEKIRLKRAGDPAADVPVHKTVSPLILRRETT